jgi:hypothetical protein
LLYFIYVRNTIAKSFHVSFKGRWAKSDGGPGRQPLPLWMSYKECLYITKVLYDDDVKVREFMSIVNTQMVGQKSDVSDTRRLDISMFLHFAVVDYHQTHDNEGGPGAFFVPPLTSPHPSSLSQPHVTSSSSSISKTISNNTTVNLFDIASSSDDHIVDNHLDSYLAALHQERREDRGSSIGSGDYELDQINLQSIAYHQQQYYDDDNINQQVEDINNNINTTINNNDVNNNDDDDDEADEFTHAQIDIENEVLARILLDTPDDIIDYIAQELQNHIRLKIHHDIDNIDINDLQHFQEVLVSITTDSIFIQELEQCRDDLIEQIMRELGDEEK